MAPLHGYAAPGTYLAKLTVTDDAGVQAVSEYRVVINDPPRAKAGPDQIVTDSFVAFDGRGSYDNDGQIVDYAWSFRRWRDRLGPGPRARLPPTGPL